MNSSDVFSQQENVPQLLVGIGPFHGLLSSPSQYYVPRGFARTASFMSTQDTFGALKSSKGRQAILTVPSTTIDGMGRFHRTGNNPETMVSTPEPLIRYATDPVTPPSSMTNTIAYPGGWTAGTTYFEQYADFMFVSNGLNQPQKIDSSHNISRIGTDKPGAGLTAAAGAAGNLIGDYVYAVTFETATQESSPCDPSNQALITVDSLQVNLSGIPQPTDAAVLHINIYRSGGTLSQFFFVDQIAVGTTTYIDNFSDTTVSFNQPLATFYGYGGAQTFTRDAPLNFTFFVQHNSQMWGFLPQADSGKRSPSGWAYFSNPDEPEGWNVNNAVPFDPNDGDKIQTAISMGSLLVVFKYASTYTVIGSSPVDFRPLKLFDYGCIAPASADVTTKGLVWLAQDGLRLWNGQGDSTLFTSQINNEIQQIAQADREAAVGVFSSDLASYFLMFPTTGKTYRFNFLTDGVDTLPFAGDFAMELSAFGDPHTIYATGGVASATIDKWYAVTGDKDSTVGLDWISDRMILGDPRVVNQATDLFVLFDGASSAFNVTLTWDGGSRTNKTETFSIAPSNNDGFEYNTIPLDALNQGVDLKVRIHQTDNTKDCIVYAVAVYGYPERFGP